MLTGGLSPTQLRTRVPLLVLAFAVIGVGIALTVRADLGLSPWDVLHQGIGEQVGLSIGTAAIVVGGVVFLAWVPLRTRPGPATVLNLVLIGSFTNLALLVVPEDPSTVVRWIELAVGVFLFGPGIALYLGCGLGAGPRDGIMTALVERGGSIRTIRTAMELSVLVVGFLLGGTVGVGTVLFALTVGPNIHWHTERLAPRFDPVGTPAT